MENGSQSFELDGHEALGSYLRIQPCTDNAPELSKCSIQWYRVSPEGGKKELISGIYAVIFCCFAFYGLLRIDYYSNCTLVLFSKCSHLCVRDYALSLSLSKCFFLFQTNLMAKSLTCYSECRIRIIT